MPTHVVAGPPHRVAPVLVRHAVVVLLAESNETDRDFNDLDPAVFEVDVDCEQLRLRVPA